VYRVQEASQRSTVMLRHLAWSSHFVDYGANWQDSRVAHVTLH